jgi:hypothetical protein
VKKSYTNVLADKWFAGSRGSEAAKKVPSWREEWAVERPDAIVDWLVAMRALEF